MASVFVVESTEGHIIGNYTTCIEGVFATVDAARTYLAEEGYVEDGDAPAHSEGNGDAVSGPFRHADCGDTWNSTELVIARWEVRG